MMMMVMGWMDCEEEEESFVGRVGWERINHAGEKRRLSGLRSRGQVSRSEEERRLPGWFWQRRYLNWPNCSSRMAAADCLNRTIILIFCPQFVASELPSSQAPRFSRLPSSHGPRFPSSQDLLFFAFFQILRDSQGFLKVLKDS